MLTPATRAGVVMRVMCSSEVEKDEWVRAVNMEVKQLRSISFSLGGANG